MSKVETTIMQKIFLISIFGMISILGTYSGFPVKNAIANTRAIGIIASGLIAGPFVGVGVGFISGLHRYSLGGLTINAAIISTVMQGYLSGLIHNRIRYRRSILFESFFIGALLEGMHMLIILAITRPLNDAVSLVKIIGPPMMIINSLGVFSTIAILEKVYEDEEKTLSQSVELALLIANKTLPYLKKGLNEASAQKASKIIFDTVGNFDLVCFTSTNKILAYIGKDDSFVSGNDKKIRSVNIKKCLKSGEIVSFSSQEHPKSGYKHNLSRIIIPLKVDKSVVGTVVLSKLSKNCLTQFEIKLSKGLAQLISTQLEIGKFQQMSQLIAQAEIRALQAQINPHFLFNALNTIAYYIISDPKTARDLIIHLGLFFRKNLVNLNKMVDVETEIEHIKSFLIIEMARFNGKLNIEYNISPDCKSMLPPLILQPIVENSIKHGLLPQKNGGNIWISGYRKNSFIVFEVEDDGVGMDKNRIAEILSTDKEIDSFGLRNVKARLEYIYGSECKFLIKSNPGSGTKVSIHFPVIEGGSYAESSNRR